jgi:hypothetical protein
MRLASVGMKATSSSSTFSGTASGSSACSVMPNRPTLRVLSLNFPLSMSPASTSQARTRQGNTKVVVPTAPFSLRGSRALKTIRLSCSCCLSRPLAGLSRTTRIYSSADSRRCSVTCSTRLCSGKSRVRKSRPGRNPTSDRRPRGFPRLRSAWQTRALRRRVARRDPSSTATPSDALR